MKLHDQCCLLEQAKRLKELGVIQQSVACFIGEELHLFEKSFYNWAEQKNMVAVAAFTVAELSVMLPDYYPSWRFKVNESSGELKWVVTVICSPKPPGIDDIHTAHAFDRLGKTQAEALATLLIALLDTKVISVDEVNQRLLNS